MSRFYSMGLEVKKDYLTEAEFQIIKEIFNGEWAEDDGYLNGEGATFFGENSLCGGVTEEEAHNSIRDIIKKEIPDCSVLTRWTYLEDLPCEEYRD